MEPEDNFEPSAGRQLQVRCGQLLACGQWHHLAVVVTKEMKRNCTISTYLDGQAIGSAKVRWSLPELAPPLPPGHTALGGLVQDCTFSWQQGWHPVRPPCCPEHLTELGHKRASLQNVIMVTQPMQKVKRGDESSCDCCDRKNRHKKTCSRAKNQDCLHPRCEFPGRSEQGQRPTL